LIVLVISNVFITCSEELRRKNKAKTRALDAKFLLGMVEAFTDIDTACINAAGVTYTEAGQSTPEELDSFRQIISGIQNHRSKMLTLMLNLSKKGDSKCPSKEVVVDYYDGYPIYENLPSDPIYTEISNDYSEASKLLWTKPQEGYNDLQLKHYWVQPVIPTAEIVNQQLDKLTKTIKEFVVKFGSSVSDDDLKSIQSATAEAKVPELCPDASEDTKKGITGTFAKLKKSFDNILNIARKCLKGASLAGMVAKAVAENVALLIPGINLLAGAWRILKTLWKAGKAVYYLYQGLTGSAADKSLNYGRAAGYFLNAIIYLTTGISKRHKMRRRRLH
jgi:hypothetical protein